MPALETERLIVREFVSADLDAVYRLLDVELADADVGTEGALSLTARRRWLEWTVLNYEQLAYLRQPPYGDRAIVLRANGELIGSCGLVPCLAPFGQLPIFHQSGDDQPTPVAKVVEAAEASLERRSTVGATPEVGLYYAVSPRHQRRGYATEAARALADYAFTRLHVARIVATTSDENEASKRVMAKLGMRVGRNPLSTPHWLQVVGILEAPRSQSGL